MNKEDINILLRDTYNLDVIGSEKIKNVYRVETQDEIYCFKVVKYDLDHFLFILGAIKHLKDKEFNYIPDIIKTSSGEDYIRIDENFAYLTHWINARECNYDNPIDLYNAARKLGELHKKSEGFQINDTMKPKIGWFKWIEVYRTRKSEIIDFQNRILKKEKTSDFDDLYLKVADEEIKRSEAAIQGLIKSNYERVMLKHVTTFGFCHHDYAHHNVLVSQGRKINIIDFDYCILDSYLHDLSSLMIRAMKYGKWDIDKARYILNSYSEVHDIAQEDIPIMAAFMEFPQDYWQRGVQYYWERKPWKEEFFLKKLNSYIEDVQYRRDFLEDFKNFKL